LEAAAGTAGQQVAEASSLLLVQVAAAAAAETEEEEAPRAEVVPMEAGWEAAVTVEPVEMEAAETVVAGPVGHPAAAVSSHPAVQAAGVAAAASAAAAEPVAWEAAAAWARGGP